MTGLGRGVLDYDSRYNVADNGVSCGQLFAGGVYGPFMLGGSNDGILAATGHSAPSQVVVKMNALVWHIGGVWGGVFLMRKEIQMLCVRSQTVNCTRKNTKRAI